MKTMHRENAAECRGRPPGTRPGSRGMNGFSLAELLIVIAIIGILATVTVFAWQRFMSNTNLRTAARDIASEFSLAKENAIKESRNYTITFDVNANTFTMAPTGTTKNLTVYGTDIRLVSASFGFGGTVITFQPRGVASAGNVQLTNGRGSTASVVVNITGKNHVDFTMQ